MTMERSEPDPTDCEEFSLGRPAAVNASLTFVVVRLVPAAWIWNCEPPANSMP